MESSVLLLFLFLRAAPGPSPPLEEGVQGEGARHALCLILLGLALFLSGCDPGGDQGRRNADRPTGVEVVSGMSLRVWR